MASEVVYEEISHDLIVRKTASFFALTRCVWCTDKGSQEVVLLW
jgi:hypothetical protein